MEDKTLVWANMKRHKRSMIGIFILVLIVSIAMNVVLTLWINSESYIHSEMDRLGFGTMTAWVSRVPDTNDLVDELEALVEIEHVETQRLIYSNYTINDQESDIEGQLIPHDEKETYKFFADDLSAYQQIIAIERGTVYVSPALISMFGVKIDDEITFPIARQGKNMTLTVKGFYEDPLMGSSMISMKGFLINEEDYFSIQQIIQSTEIDALARDGAMLHLFKEERSEIPISELENQLNTNTTLSKYIEFMHSRSTISDFMLILQKAFGGFLTAFVLVLFLAVIIVLRSSIDHSIESDYLNMGILKTIGFTSKKLRKIQLIQYLFIILASMCLSVILVLPVNSFMAQATLSTTGFLVPTTLPIKASLCAFSFIFILLILFIVLKTVKIGAISPLKVLRGETEKRLLPSVPLSIHGKGLLLRLSIRSAVSERQKYLGACLIAVLLVFFVSLVGRMDSWLGEDGQGMMDAFNPADHDIGVQVLGDLSLAETESTIQAYTGIIDHYMLAMPTVAVNGTSYTANVISEPERFHLLSGKTSLQDNEVVLTQVVAADLGVAIGDTLTIFAGENSQDYQVSGIYQCANDMGGNIGMSREGYLRIAQDNPHLWCSHYFLEDPSQKTAITEALEATYGGDVHVHENSWPGLQGIIAAMQALVIFMVVLSAIFILIVTIMTGSKILEAEQKDLAIYKTLGFTSRRLRLAFALRFGLVADLGSTLGIIMAALMSDSLVLVVMRFCGISNYGSNPSIVTILLPALLVTTLFMCFAYLASKRIKNTSVTILTAE